MTIVKLEMNQRAIITLLAWRTKRMTFLTAFRATPRIERRALTIDSVVDKSAISTRKPLEPRLSTPTTTTDDEDVVAGAEAAEAVEDVAAAVVEEVEADTIAETVAVTEAATTVATAAIGREAEPVSSRIATRPTN